jgi:RNA-directed DNA polymerase
MPKSFRNLWPQVVSFENLHWAWRNARRGKRGTASVASFDIAAEDHVFALQDALENGRYRSFTLRESGKLVGGWRRRLDRGPTPVVE